MTISVYSSFGQIGKFKKLKNKTKTELSKKETKTKSSENNNSSNSSVNSNDYALLEKYYKVFVQNLSVNTPEGQEPFNPSYSDYKKYKSEKLSKSSKISDYYQKQFDAVDKFFSTDVYTRVSYLDGKLDKLIKKIHAPNYYKKEDYLLNARGYSKKINELYEIIKYNKTNLMEDKTEINKVETKLLKEKELLDKYINSGKLDLYREQNNKELINSVRLGKKQQTNVKYEQMAMDGVKKGIPLRAVITTSTWRIKTTPNGYPIYKYLDVDIAIKEGEKCWLSYGQIRKQYEGGGQYGNEYFYYWGKQGQMNCNNVTK